MKILCSAINGFICAHVALAAWCGLIYAAGFNFERGEIAFLLAGVGILIWAFSFLFGLVVTQAGLEG